MHERGSDEGWWNSRLCSTSIPRLHLKPRIYAICIPLSVAPLWVWIATPSPCLIPYQWKVGLRYTNEPATTHPEAADAVDDNYSPLVVMTLFEETRARHFSWSICSYPTSISLLWHVIKGKWENPGQRRYALPLPIILQLVTLPAPQYEFQAYYHLILRGIGLYLFVAIFPCLRRRCLLEDLGWTIPFRAYGYKLIIFYYLDNATIRIRCKAWVEVKLPLDCN